jgi:hypothetical protein
VGKPVLSQVPERRENYLVWKEDLRDHGLIFTFPLQITDS